MSYEPHPRTPLAPKPYFDDNSPRYRLCCCHVRTWAMVIGILELIGIIIQLISGIANYTTANDLYGSMYYGFTADRLSGMIGGIVVFVIWAIVVILLLYGIKKEKHMFLIPHMIIQILSIMACIAMAIYYFVMGAEWGNLRFYMKDDTGAIHEGLGVSIAGGIALMIIAGIEILFLYAIYRCYQYLKEKNLALASNVPTSTSYAAVEKGRL